MHQALAKDKERILILACWHMQRSPLKAGDADIHVVSPAELTHQPQFSLDRYKAALRSKLLGQSILVTASIPSTQTVLHQNFSTLPDGIICIADTQTSGKGSLPVARLERCPSCNAHSACCLIDLSCRPRLEYLGVTNGLLDVLGLQEARHSR